MEKVNKVLWTDKSEEALLNIYNFYAEKSEVAALHLIEKIIDTGDSITLTKQYQVDDINPNYRRMIVGHHKILYKEINNTVWIMNVIDSRQDPAILENL